MLYVTFFQNFFVFIQSGRWNSGLQRKIGMCYNSGRIIRGRKSSNDRIQPIHSVHSHDTEKIKRKENIMHLHYTR